MKKEQNTGKRTSNRTQNTAVIPFRKKRRDSVLGRIVRRFLLVLITVIVLLLGDLLLVLNLVFNGPSPTARNQLTMALIEASATKWVPALFIGEETVAEIRADVDTGLEDNLTDTSAVIINRGNQAGSDSEWSNYPDGIRIEDVHGRTYNAKVMLVCDPAQVYLGISTHNGFSTSIPGKRLTAAMADEGAIAGINGGAFNDDGTTGSYVGTLPAGLVYSDGECVWTSGKPSETSGFAGFTKDNILVVSTDNLSKAQAEELNIRDGCCFGPVLIMNGEINMEAYNTSDFCRYSDTLFSVRVSVTLNQHRKDGSVKESIIDQSLFFEKQSSDKWLCYAMTAEDVMKENQQVRLTFKNGDTVLQSDFYDTSITQLMCPVVTAPDGKHFSGWVTEERNEDGETVMNLVFQPDESGKVFLSAGNTLEPMTLFPLFE